MNAVLSNRPTSFKRTTAIAVGAAVVLGALALPKVGVAQSFGDARLPNIPTATQTFSGMLSNVRAPQYDGPIKWEDRSPLNSFGYILGGLVGLIVGFAGVVVIDKCSWRGISPGAAVLTLVTGFAAGSLIIGPLASDDTVALTFSTKVSDVPIAENSHYERHGKTTSGPYYSQIVLIPESPIPLAANVQDGPFIPGQNINATIFINKDTRQIVSWVASAGLRPAQ